MFISSCLICEAAGTVSLSLPSGRIYSDLTELTATYTGEPGEIIFKLDNETLGSSSDGTLAIESGTLTPGNHIIEAVALYTDKTAACDKRDIVVYKKYDGLIKTLNMGTTWNGTYSISPVTDVFDKEGTSYKVGFTGGQQYHEMKLPASDIINCQYGDRVKLTTYIAVQNDSDFENAVQLGFNPIGTHTKVSSTSGKNLSIDYTASLNVNFKSGAMAPGYGATFTVPSTYAKCPCSSGVWNKYEFVYTIGRGQEGDDDYVSNKLSVYKDGNAVFENHDYLSSNGAIKTITGAAFFERGRRKTLYFSDVSLTHYRADFGAEEISYLKNSVWTPFTNNLSSDAEKLKLKLNTPMDSATLTTSNISLISDKGSKTISDISLNSDASEITLTATEGFSKGENLKLEISPNVKTLSGVTIDEKLVMRFKTENAPLTPNNVGFTKNGNLIYSANQLENGDTISAVFDIDIPVDEPDGVVAYLCIRQNKRLCSIKPVKINTSGTGITITSNPITGLEGDSNIEVKLIICDDFVTTKPYNMIKID